MHLLVDMVLAYRDMIAIEEMAVNLRCCTVDDGDTNNPRVFYSCVCCAIARVHQRRSFAAVAAS